MVCYQNVFPKNHHRIFQLFCILQIFSNDLCNHRVMPSVWLYFRFPPCNYCFEHPSLWKALHTDIYIHIHVSIFSLLHCLIHSCNFLSPTFCQLYHSCIRSAKAKCNLHLFSSKENNPAYENVYYFRKKYLKICIFLIIDNLQS